MRFRFSFVSALIAFFGCGFLEHEEPKKPMTNPGTNPGAAGFTPVAGTAGAGVGTGGSTAAAGGNPGAGMGPEGGGTTSAGQNSAGQAGGGGTVASAGASPGGAAGTFQNPGPPYAYPQNKRSSHCFYPTMAHHDHARAAYDRWKMELVTTEGANGFARVRRPANEEDTTVSEGIAYGMILSVAMGDQALFDNFWKYSRQPSYLTGGGLMHWKILPSGMVAPDGQGAATDADEDMAWALILADKKWGGRGSLEDDYLNEAKAQIQRIWDHEIDHDRGDLLLAGDSWGETVVFNPSYFAPNQYRLFGVVSGNVEGWTRVIDTGYDYLLGTLTEALGNAQNGLVPAWGLNDGQPATPWAGAPTHYQYDSARVPFRIGQDYCEFGEPRAKTYLDKSSAFFAAIGASNILDGYDLNGTPRPENPTAQSALFVGAAAVGAMSDMRYRAFVDEAYNLLVTKEMFPPSYYYNMSWQVFSLLMMTGNLFDYTLHP